MADTKKAEGLVYKNHPLRRVDNLIYYGSMADKYIVLLQILDTVKEQDMDVAQARLRPAPAHRPRPEEPGPRGEEDREGQSLCRHGRGAASGWSALWPESCKAIMKRLFSALAVVLASLLVVGGDAVLSGGASAHAVSAPQAIPVTLASVPSPLSVPLVTPDAARLSLLAGAAVPATAQNAETAEDAAMNNSDLSVKAAADDAEAPDADDSEVKEETPVSTPIQALGVVSGTDVRVRSGAGTGYDILKTLDKGTLVELTVQEGDWYRISYDGARGYIASQYITRYDSATGLSGAGKVTADVLNIRSAPKSGSTSLGTASHGAVLTVTGIEGSWFAVSYNGVSGYVASQYVLICSPSTADTSAPETPEETPAETPDEKHRRTTPPPPFPAARSSRWRSSIWAFPMCTAAPPSGFDCSGFTMYIFAQVGVEAPPRRYQPAELRRFGVPQRAAARRSGVLPGLWRGGLPCGHLHRRRPVHPRLVLLRQQPVRDRLLAGGELLRQPLLHRPAALKVHKNFPVHIREIFLPRRETFCPPASLISRR